MMRELLCKIFDRARATLSSRPMCAQAHARKHILCTHTHTQHSFGDIDFSAWHSRVCCAAQAHTICCINKNHRLRAREREHPTPYVNNILWGKNIHGPSSLNNPSRECRIQIESCLSSKRVPCGHFVDTLVQETLAVFAGDNIYR